MKGIDIGFTFTCALQFHRTMLSGVVRECGILKKDKNYHSHPLALPAPLPDVALRRRASPGALRERRRASPGALRERET